MLILEIFVFLITIVSLYLIMSNKIRNKSLFIGLFGLIVVVSVLHLVLAGFMWQLLLLYIAIDLLIIFGYFIKIREISIKKTILKIVTILTSIFIVLSGLFVFSFPKYKMPEPRGDYLIGTSTFIVNDDRPEIYTDDPNDTRRIKLQVWYPAETVEGYVQVPWLLDGITISKALSKDFGFPAFALNQTAKVLSNSYLDAPISNIQDKYPIVIISHGWRGFRNLHTDFAEELASTGYIVVSIDHTYGSVATFFEEDDVAYLNKDALPSRESTPDFLDYANRLVSTYGEDVISTIDYLEVLNSNSELSNFSGRLDLTKIGVIGHSTATVVDADTNGLYTFTTNGVYQVLYTLLDSSGNAANETRYISVVDAPTGMTNILTEGDFATTTEWGTWVPDWGVIAVAAFDATSGAMVADITDVGDDTWHVQLFNSTADLVSGTTYVISFEASSTVARDIFVELIDGNNQWTASLNTTTQRFAFEYTAGADVTDAKLNFLLGLVNGATASVITIDNVMVYEKVENTNIVTEGDFATTTEWGTWVPDWGVVAVAAFDATSGAMVADITDVGDDTWHVQLFNSTADLVAGTIYTITFDASSTVDRDILFEVIDGNNQFKASLTSTTTTFTFTFLSTADVTDAKINFLLGLVNGAAASVVTIDNVNITANPVN